MSTTLVNTILLFILALYTSLLPVLISGLIIPCSRTPRSKTLYGVFENKNASHEIHEMTIISHVETNRKLK
jgi:hypothetical protein